MAGKSSSTKDRVYSELKGRILNGQYPFGSKLNINAIAAEFNVSNSPVREACSRLENDFLIDYSTNSGARVIMMNAQLYHDIADTMSICQQGAYEYCIRRDRKSFLLEIMKSALLSVEIATEAKDKKNTTISSMIFWNSFIKATGNSYYQAVSKKIFDLYLLAEIYNHHAIELDYEAIFTKDAQLLDDVANDRQSAVTNSIFAYKVYHIEA